MRFKTFAAIVLFIISLSCSTKPDSTTSGSRELKPRNSPIAVGEMAPDFTLEDHNNEKVSLSSSRGVRPTVLVFYRGYW